MKFKKTIFLLPVLTSFYLPSESFAAGFAADLHSASGLGNSHAGAAVGAHDASDIFINPANLSGLKSKQAIASFSYLNLNIDADNASGSGGSAETHDAGVDAVIPALYLALPINDKFSFGTAITVPYGLATQYDDNWAGSEYATESQITTLNFNPAFSYKVNNQLAVAGGVQVQYIDAILKRNIATIYPAKVTGDDVGYGYNLGLTYNLTDDLKFGFGYRSKIDHKLRGYVDTTAPSVTDKISSKLTTPESATFGLGYKINDKSEVLYDFSWVRWSRINSVNVVNSSGTTIDAINFNFKDSLKYSLGYNYQLNDKFLIRTGAAYEKDAVTDTYREPRIPTGDRIWTTLGFGYKIAKNTTIDGAYLHQFYKTVKSSNNNSGGPGNYTTTTAQAKYKTSVNVLAFSVKQEF